MTTTISQTISNSTCIACAGDVFSANTLVHNAAAMVKAGAMVSSSILSAGGLEDVFSGGVTSKTTILSGGRVWLAGGMAYDTIVSSGGTMPVCSYGDDVSYASKAQIFSGGFIESGTSIYVHSSSGYAENTSYDQNVNASGAVITLALAERKATDDYSIVNLDHLGETSLTINCCQALADKNDTFSRGMDNNLIKMAAYSESGKLHFGLGNCSELTFQGIDGITSGYVAAIGGLSVKDFTFVDEVSRVCYFQHSKVTDAEKSDRNSWDDLWCGPMTETNILEVTGHLNRAGFQSGDELMAEMIAKEIPKSEVRPRTYVFSRVETPWKITWGSFDRTGKTNTWLQQADAQLRSGNYLGWFQVEWGEPDAVTGNHAMTLYGFTYDSSYSPDDPRYYSGVIIADSDDNKHNYNVAANAPNILKIERIVWDESTQNYRFRNGAGFLDNVWTIKKITAGSSADLTWYHPNDWNDWVTITNNADESNDCSLLQAGQELYANIAIQNQGTAATGAFFVSIYLDGNLKEDIRADSLAGSALAALEHYSLGKLAAGEHTIQICIDARGNVTEQYEQNNCFTKVFTVFETEKLHVSSGTDIILYDGQNLLGAYLSSGVGLDARYSGCTISGNTLDAVKHTVAIGENFTGNTLLNDACATVSSGAVMTENIVGAGGVEDVFSGGITSKATILSGGRVLLAGGTARDTIVSSGGGLYVRSYGGDLSYASQARIFSGGRMDVYDSSVAEETVIHSGGYARVYNYGSAFDTVIESGASMYVYSSCGYAENTTVSGFGRVYDGGLMSDTTITSGGSFHLWRGGTLKDVLVQYGGLLDLRQSAPVLTGDVRVAGQLRASYDQNVNASGAIITLDLTERRTADDYSIVNLNYLGNAALGIELSKNQSAGVYKLASNSALYHVCLTVSVGGHCATATLSVGRTVSYRGYDLTLTRKSAALSLNVSHNSNFGNAGPDAPTVVASCDSATTQNVTVSATFNEENVTKQYSLDGENWQDYIEDIVFQKNGSVWFRAIDSENEISPVTKYTVDIIDRSPPVIELAGDTSTPLQQSSITASTESGLDIYYSQDNKNWTKYKGTLEVTSNGTWYFKATDAAGNVGTNSIEFKNIDTVAPVINLTGDTTTSLQKSSITASTESGVDIYYSTDNKTWEKYTAKLDVTANGTWYFKATDTAGNVGTNSIEFKNIDTVAPSVNNVRINEPNTNASILVSFQCDNDVSQRFYSIMGGKWTEIYENQFAIEQNGKVRIRLTDAAGNEYTSESIIITGFNTLLTGLCYAQIPEKTDAIILSWDKGGINHWTREYELELSINNLSLDLPQISGEGLEIHGLGKSDVFWSITPVQSELTTEGPVFTFEGTNESSPQVVQTVEDDIADVLLVRRFDLWNENYQAQHIGSMGDWDGTHEIVSLKGKNKIADVISGSEDVTLLYLTDDANGDALFVDDIYSEYPDGLLEAQVRIAQIDEIRAGAGDDIVDMTSQRFVYIGNGVVIHGGLGDDTLWANLGDNRLFGDAGNDRLVGASGNDVLIGGIGNDSMHGGGGIDVFTFCTDWGQDTVEQLAGGDFRLWFAHGIDEDDLTLSADGTDTLISQTGTDNSILVKNTSVADVQSRLIFGEDGEYKDLNYSDLSEAGAFSEFTSEKIFEKKEYAHGIIVPGM